MAKQLTGPSSSPISQNRQSPPTEITWQKDIDRNLTASWSNVKTSVLLWFILSVSCQTSTIFTNIFFPKTETSSSSEGILSIMSRNTSPGAKPCSSSPSTMKICISSIWHMMSSAKMKGHNDMGWIWVLKNYDTSL